MCVVHFLCFVVESLFREPLELNGFAFSVELLQTRGDCFGGDFAFFERLVTNMAALSGVAPTTYVTMVLAPRSLLSLLRMTACGGFGGWARHPSGLITRLRKGCGDASPIGPRHGGRLSIAVGA